MDLPPAIYPLADSASVAIRSGATLPLQNTAYAAARIGDISGIAWNQVQMHMHARLSCDFPDIDADIIAVRVTLPGNAMLRNSCRPFTA